MHSEVEEKEQEEVNTFAMSAPGEALTADDDHATTMRDANGHALLLHSLEMSAESH